MTSTTATPGEAARGSRLGAHLVVALVFLSWTAHASSIIGLLAGNATAQIAIHFRTTQIAWFTLAPSLLGLFLSPRSTGPPPGTASGASCCPPRSLPCSAMS